MSDAKKPKGTQHDKFKDLARKLGTHEEEERFVEALRQVSKGKIDLDRPRPLKAGGKSKSPKSAR